MIVKLRNGWFNTAFTVRGERSVEDPDGRILAHYPDGQYVVYEGEDARTFARAMDEVSVKWPVPGNPEKIGPGGEDPAKSMTPPYLALRAEEESQNGDRPAM